MSIDALTGQFGVVRTSGLDAALIRLGTRSQVNHAFIYLDSRYIVEAEGTGAIVSPATKYPQAIRSRFDLSSPQRLAIADQARSLVGTPYNYADIADITLLTLGVRWKWLQDYCQSDKSLICSQLVDRAYSRANVHLFRDGRPDGLVTPGDLLMLIAEGSTRTVLPAGEAA